MKEHELHAAPTRCLELLQTVSEKEWEKEEKNHGLCQPDVTNRAARRVGKVAHWLKR